MSESQATTEGSWYYEEKGRRKGPFSENEIIQFIKESVISHGTSVWKHGFPDWLKIEKTDLSIHLDNSGPPPLSGTQINNTIVWVLAFAPLIGYLLEWMIAGVVHGDDELSAAIDMANGNFWYITLGLNIALAYFDEKKLKEAGHNTDNFKGWIWLVPVYLYQRAKATAQNMAYFITWIVCFVLVVFS